MPKYIATIHETIDYAGEIEADSAAEGHRILSDRCMAGGGLPSTGYSIDVSCYKADEEALDDEADCYCA